MILSFQKLFRSRPETDAPTQFGDDIDMNRVSPLYGSSDDSGLSRDDQEILSWVRHVEQGDR